MNITKIEWTDRSLNPIVGCLNHCEYCYARRQAKRSQQVCDQCHTFHPHFHPKRLNQLSPQQKPLKIFMSSMADWNSPGVQKKWITQIIKKMEACPQHTFQVLSKSPEGYHEFDFPRNVWLGTSITETYTERVGNLIFGNRENLKFLSVEPIHGPVWSVSGVDWVIVGAETGNRKEKVIPKKEWITEVINSAKKYKIPIFLKGNLNWSERIEEFPNDRRL